MNLSAAPNINLLWAKLIVEELVRNGVDYFCISPGSRSSPLTVAVAENKKAKSFIHYDERGSAFHALGFTSATGRPSAVISTSGTAAANYFPAVIEASKKKLPLIVLTADRPPELRFTGAVQTIDQVKIFGDYVRMFFDMPVPTKEIKPQMVLTTIDSAVNQAKGSLPGPVHINCMFREPLAPIKTQANFSHYLRDLEQWMAGGSAFTTYTRGETAFSEKNKKQLNATIAKIHSGVIVVGKLKSKREQEQVLKISQRLNWPVFGDITSGLRSEKPPKNVIPFYDQLLLSEKLQKNIKVDGVLHIGGRITSKRWYQWMEDAKPKHYIMINNHPLRNDPLHNVTLRINSNIDSIATAILRIPHKPGQIKQIEKLNTLSTKVDSAVEKFLSRDERISEISVARNVSALIPKNSGLFLASSMPIREMDMYAMANMAPVTIGSNRGASGIDGTVATAAGFATGLNKPTTLLIGDLALLHDLNSLVMLQALQKPFVVIVFNNNGGGIFSFLPIAKFTDVFDKYFGTPHNLNFEAASQLFKLNYAKPQTVEEFKKEYTSALHAPKATIIEIISDRAENLAVHQKLQKEIRTVLNKSLSRK